MTDNLFWLGHDGFRITGTATVYIDPYQIVKGKTADLILLTHEHFDHCSSEDIGKIQGPDTVIVGTTDTLAKVTGNTISIRAGETITVRSVVIEAVPAYNRNKKFHPKASGWIGYVITINGVKIYHAGDTDHIPEMQRINADVALLPVSGTYVMTADEAAEAALEIRPQFAIPMHYGSIVGGDADAARFKKALEGKIAVIIKEKVE